ncbi:MAG: FG-GAP-like repeat-containing protein [Thermodesulfobacteriota bacterium]
MNILTRQGPKSYRRRLILEQLEERIVLDATVATAAQDHPVDATQADTHQSSDTHTDAQTTATTSQSDPNATKTTDAGTTDVSTAGPVSQTSAQSQDNPLGTAFDHGNDVILVSNTLPDSDALKTAASAGATVVEYDGVNGNLDTMTEALHDLVKTTGQKIEHLAFVSHGDPGILNLSDAESWSAYTVQSKAASWTALGALLTEDARIDFYGCDIGKGSDGAGLLASVAAVTGATVWASDNPTGSGADHDWTLEVKTGESTLPSLLDSDKLASTSITLDNTVITNGSFEQAYTGWTLKDTPVLPAGYYFPWLSTWGIVSGGTIAAGTFNNINDPSDVTNPYYDYADNYDKAPQIAAGIDTQNFSATDGMNVAFAAQTYNSNMTVSQDITLPDGTKTLSWDMRYWNYYSKGFSDDGDPVTGDTLDQFLSVSLYDAGHNLIETLVKTAPVGDHSDVNDPFHARTNLTAQNMDTTHFDFDVSMYVGKTVTLEVEVSAERTLLAAGFDHFTVDVNHKPVAYDQAVATFEDTPAVIALGGHDSDPGAGQTLTFFLNTLPTNGSLYATEADATAGVNALAAGAELATNKVWYKTAVNDPSDTSFTFYVKDNGGGGNDTSSNALVTIDNNVMLTSHPTADNITTSTPLSTPITIKLTGHDADKPVLADVHFDPYDYDAAKAGIQTSKGGTLVKVADSLWTDDNGNYSEQYLYTPAKRGTDTFTYTFTTPNGSWQGFDAGGTTFGADTSQTTFDVETADLNHDGNLDIIAAKGNWSGSTGIPSYFYLGNGSGGFTSGTQLGTDTETKCAISLGDFNGDGYVDVASRNYNNARVYLWDPAAISFKSGVALANAQNGDFGGIGVGDLDGDGDADIVVGKNTGTDLVYFNDGYGNFDSGTPIDTTASGWTSTVDVSDVTGDGNPDIIVGKTYANNLILVNDGYGHFNETIVLPTPTGGNRNPQYIVVGDVDGNGTRDIVVANDGSGSAGTETFYRNDGFNGFTAIDIGSGDSSGGIRLADLNHDGTLDVVAGNYNGAVSKYYLFDKTTGLFSAGVSFGAGNTFGTAVGDFNGDGFADVVATTDVTGLKHIFLNKGLAAEDVSPAATVTITVTRT